MKDQASTKLEEEKAPSSEILQELEKLASERIAGMGGSSTDVVQEWLKDGRA